MSFIYNCTLFFLSLATVVLQWSKVKKRGGYFFRSKLGIGLSKIKLEDKKRVWIHAVSLGEIKSSETLIKQHLAEGYQVLVSTSTDTAFSWAHKIKEIELFYLPIDLSFNMRRFMKRLKPKKLIIVESDIWPQMLRFAKKERVCCQYVSAKISIRSFKRLMRCKPLARALYKNIDLIEVQNQHYLECFKKLGVEEARLKLGKNLKFVNSQRALKFNHIELETREGVIMLSCTHEGEEKLLLSELHDLMGKYTLIVAPRHPERFDRVFELLRPFGVQKTSSQLSFYEPFILVDEMGVLDCYYNVSDCIVMGGSFVSDIGGHNLLEPLRHSKTLFFGPHMQNQVDITSYALTLDQCHQTPLESLKGSLIKVFEEKRLH
jgi:3-deoxy-D-manno-octulosonic-acid transferase